MKEASNWTVPKWPFLALNVLLLAFAWFLIANAAHPIKDLVIITATLLAALGALAGMLPFILEYRGASKLVEINALTTVTEQLQNLEKYAEQVAGATDQWARVQEATQAGAEKTVAGARDITERMATEVRNFSEFQARLNDGEKQAMRLEVEKLRRVEGDWLQVLARILDHVFSLHTAAVRSGQPEIAAQIGQFQNACRDTARRVGLVPFLLEPNTALDAQICRVHGVENPPADAIIAETLAPGLNFQGRLIRPALVRLQSPAVPAPVSDPVPVAVTEPEPTPAAVPEPPPVVPISEETVVPETSLSDIPKAEPTTAPVAESAPTPAAEVTATPPAATVEASETANPIVTPIPELADASESPVVEPTPAAATEAITPMVAAVEPAAEPPPLKARKRGRGAAVASPTLNEPASEAPSPAPEPLKEEKPVKPVASAVPQDLFDTGSN